MTIIGKNKMGRPTDNPKTNGYRIRMTDDELIMLEKCCKKTGMSKADVIRLGIKTVYESTKRED